LNKFKVLVTGTGQLGVGEGIVKCLQMIPESYELISANADLNAISLFTSDSGALLPLASCPTYIDTLVGLVQKVNAEFLIPGSEPEMRVIADNRDRFTEIACLPLANSSNVLNATDDKLNAYEFLHCNGLPTPVTSGEISIEKAEEFGFPVVLKPRLGGGGKHVYVLKNADEFLRVIATLPLKLDQLILQEYLSDTGGEFTASALMMPNGVEIGSFAAKRTLVGGATGAVEIQDFPEIRRLAVQVATALRATGPINIQCRLIDGKPSIFEINPRFSGSAPFRALAGFNEPHLMIQSIANGEPMSCAPPLVGYFGVRSFTEELVPMSKLDAIQDLRKSETRLLF
jgi:carbamoyl-phosphate synthase large subunit